jgi:antitoxin ChpS
MGREKRGSEERQEAEVRAVYTLDELLAQCDGTIPISDEDREWLNAPSVGREI